MPRRTAFNFKSLPERRAAADGTTAKVDDYLIGCFAQAEQYSLPLGSRFHWCSPSAWE